MEDAAERRLRTLSRHVAMEASGAVVDNALELQTTAGEYLVDQGFSVVLPERLSEGKWNVHRSARSPLKLVNRFQEDPEVKTCHDSFERSIRVYADEPCLGTRVKPDGSVGPYVWKSYREAGALRTAIGSGLVQQGLQPGAKVGLYFINREEWVITEQACNSYAFVSVPLYDTLGPDAVKYIINHGEIVAVFCTRDKMQTLMDCLADCPSIRVIVVVGGTEQTLPLPPPKRDVVIMPYSRLEAQGRVNPLPFTPPRCQDLATICYTSGTTGTPKGAMITHKNFVASTAGMAMMNETFPGDVHISYLPLAHIYERLNVQMAIHNGVAIGFYQGDILKLMDDMQELKPTLFASVPRLYNRIYDRINATVRSAGGLKQRLFDVAYNSKKAGLRKGGTRVSPVWDRLVFNKIKERLGGRVRILATGASPISPEVSEFLQICFVARVVEGYGMTETTCVISTQEEGDNEPGSVGAPNPACEIKLVDVPEMNYTNNDKPNPRGEVCVRGPIVFKGYYKDVEQTREAVDDDGWLHTGDIGMWVDKGRLKIIDRKKNIFKLAQGEYIAPEKIENVYNRSSLVAQCFIHGDSLNAELVAVVVPDPETLPEWAKARGIPHANYEALCKDPVAAAAVLASMDQVAREAKLRGFEQAKAVFLTAEPFSIENGLLTPTFKVKRPQARAFFAKQIEQMYRDLQNKEKLPTKSKGKK